MKIDFTRVKINTTIPVKDADALRDALGRAGAGKIGDYSFCSFSVKGKGRFKPNKDADPYIGKPGELEVVDEEQVEIVCGRDIAKSVIEALRSAHPYEEPVIDITPLIDEDSL